MLSRWGAADQGCSPPLAAARRSAVATDGESESLKPVRLQLRSDRILTDDPHTAERKCADGAAVALEEAWPSWNEIRAAQTNLTQDADAGLRFTLNKEDDGMWCDASGRVFNPAYAYRL